MGTDSTVLTVHVVLASVAEVLVRVPADQRVLGVVVHGDARPVLQVAQTCRRITWMNGWTADVVHAASAIDLVTFDFFWPV